MAVLVICSVKTGVSVRVEDRPRHQKPRNIKNMRKTIKNRYFETIRAEIRRVTSETTHNPPPSLNGQQRLPLDFKSPIEHFGADVALHIDNYWRKSQVQDAGPIDVIDMFSGCGGMSAGFKAVNGFVPAFRIAGAADIDAIAGLTYNHNIGVEAAQLDVSTLAQDETALTDFVNRCSLRSGHPLVLIGCAPCQGFSSHRNSAGRTDTRNSLFVDFAKIAAKLEPDFIVVENVPELLTTSHWQFLTAARQILEDVGYRVHLSVHTMAGFGVPQERYRALLLASRRPFGPVREFLCRDEYRTVRSAIGHLNPIAAGEIDPSDPMHYTAGHKPSTVETIRAVPHNGGNRPPGVGPACLRRIETRQGRSAYDDVYGRLYWDKPSITITAYSRNPASGRFVHPEQDRGLSVREAALLQGFPSDYEFLGTLDQKFRQIGNAVPPTFAAYLAVHILNELVSAHPGSDHCSQGITQPVGDSFSRIIPALKAGHRTLVECA